RLTGCNYLYPGWRQQVKSERASKAETFLCRSRFFGWQHECPTADVLKPIQAGTPPQYPRCSGSYAASQVQAVRERRWQSSPVLPAYRRGCQPSLTTLNVRYRAVVLRQGRTGVGGIHATVFWWS